MRESPLRSDLAVLIPTSNETRDRVRLQPVLTALAGQTLLPRRVYLRDEGICDVFDDPCVRLLWDLLSHKGIETVHLRRAVRRGVAAARRDLVESLRDEDLVLCLDDDIVLEADTVERLCDFLSAAPEAGFVQGQKIELDRTRAYWNDINVLNGIDTGLEPQRVWFGDAALLLVRRRALDVVDWDIVTRFALEGLPGEDVAISLMIADRFPCWGLPAAVGWHMSPRTERWRWEPASDALQFQLLSGHVADATLQKALPHLVAAAAGAAPDAES